MCPANSGSADGIRRPVVAGQFYTDSPGDLTAQIDAFLERADGQDLPGEVLALIAPHAGYIYSGQVAAHAYKQIQDKLFETVFVIAPSHQAAFDGVSVYHGGGYQTPLGLVPVREDLVATLTGQSERIGFFPEAHSREHSLEVQLPFLQRCLGEFQLVPIIMGDRDLSTCQLLAEAICSAQSEEKTLIVASSDLSHYHSHERALELDGVILDAVNAFDPLALHQSLENRSSEACGGGPMVVALLAAGKMGAVGARVLNYADSGDVSGDRSHVVGYMAAAAFGG